MEEEGIEVILTPAQLAAVLEDETLREDGTLGNRLVGVLRIVGCGFGAVGGSAMIVAPEPTMLSKAGGWVLVTASADQCATGARQVWTGRSERSMLDRGASGVARGLGADERTARTIGVAAEIMVPLGAASLANATRASAIVSGRIRLTQHEAVSAARGAPGGHTIARHVGRTEAQMRARIAATASARRPPDYISSFSSLANAERFVSRAVRMKQAEIMAWAQSGSRAAFVRTVPMNRVTGTGIERATGSLVEMRSIRFVLRKETYNGMPYYILTSFPVP
ncbi:MAG: RNase A-like domain-containing protein [Pseudomonadota bacterium]